MTEYLLIQNINEAHAPDNLVTLISRRMAENKEEAIREFIKSNEQISIINAGIVFCLEINEIPLFV